MFLIVNHRGYDLTAIHGPSTVWGLPCSSGSGTSWVDGPATVVAAIVADGAFGASAGGVVGIAPLIEDEGPAYKYLVDDTL